MRRGLAYRKCLAPGCRHLAFRVATAGARCQAWARSMAIGWQGQRAAGGLPNILGLCLDASRGGARPGCVAGNAQLEAKVCGQAF
jgi:hypothetical protein